MCTDTLTLYAGIFKHYVDALCSSRQLSTEVSVVAPVVHVACCCLETEHNVLIEVFTVCGIYDAIVHPDSDGGIEFKGAPVECHNVSL